MDTCSYFIENKCLFGCYPNSEDVYNELVNCGVKYFVDLTTNKEKIRFQKLKHYLKHRDKILQQKAQYRKKNIKKINQYHWDNREKILPKLREYRLKNKEKIKQNHFIQKILQ